LPYRRLNVWSKFVNHHIEDEDRHQDGHNERNKGSHDVTFTEYGVTDGM